MLFKWTQKEDQELTKLVKRYGTTNWSIVQKNFKRNRSRDSIIKRWHCRLKLQRKQTEKKKTKIRKIKPIKKEEATPVASSNPSKDYNKTRSRAVNISRQPSKYVMRIPMSSRFQRLRCFLQGVKEPPRPLNRNLSSKINKQKDAKIKDKNQEEMSQQSQQSSSSDNDYQLQWSRADDQKLKGLVINQGITNWQKLSEVMGCSKEQVLKRWKNKVYKLVKMEDKVGGFLKYSSDEDAILTIGRRNGLDWIDLMEFLPGRSQYSIEARWRRFARPQFEVQVSSNKHFMIREFLKKVLQKRKSYKEPLQQKSSLI